MNQRSWLGLVALLVPVVGPGMAMGQEPPPVPAEAAPAAPPLVSADSITLVLNREVFVYPAYDRRNPFQPLTGDEGGPRFENLVLVGRLLSPDGESIALVQANPPGNTRGAQQGPLPYYRLRVGDVLGNSRVLEIREERVLVAVEEFGLSEVRTLELRRTAASARASEVQPASPGGVQGGSAADSLAVPGSVAAPLPMGPVAPGPLVP